MVGHAIESSQPGPVKPDWLWRTADALMLVAFALSVLVQLNDPDPLRWIAIYGLSSVACVFALVGRGHWLFPATVGALAAGWAAAIAPRVVGAVPFLDMFSAFEMANVGIEESREMYGLLIVAIWMGVLALRMVRLSAQSQPPPQD